MKTIEIWHTTNNCSLGDPDDEDQATACQPLLAPSIAAKNPDPDIMKTAGATAAKSRTVSYNVHFPLDSTRSFKKDVWAKVVNWAGRRGPERPHHDRRANLRPGHIGSTATGGRPRPLGFGWIDRIRIGSGDAG